ncbi:MAG: anaerobic ribonucleoside-triphosphate reductase activating protein [Erysipelotrichaceae bacterium]|nr:anaerobic ribonucleoside-triphosphate reductase activating protein [Erysipelotrichaceae bacterium]
MDKPNLLINSSILYRVTQKFYDRKLEEYDIGYGQVIFLMMIYENEGITMKELSQIGTFDKGTITKGISKLQKNDYIRLQVDPNDKRSKLLYTTEKAKDIIGKIYLLRNNWWDSLSKSLSLEEADQFERLLDQVVQNALGALNQELSPIRFYGMQKLSLLDYPGKMACTLFTGGCNFKCPFCQNADLVFLPENIVEIPIEDINAFLSKRRGLLEGICITGGEPLLHDGLEYYLEQFKAMGYSIKLDTNGSFPDRLKYLVDKGLVDYVAMDIKNAPDQYGTTIGIGNLSLNAIKQSVAYLKEGHVPYEFRTTVVSEYHHEGDIERLAQWIEGAEHYYLQQFEDSERVIKKGLHSCTKAEMLRFKEIASQYVKHVEIRGID